jgi:hypothetical protein
MALDEADGDQPAGAVAQERGGPRVELELRDQPLDVGDVLVEVPDVRADAARAAVAAQVGHDHVPVFLDEAACHVLVALAVLADAVNHHQRANRIVARGPVAPREQFVAVVSGKSRFAVLHAEGLNGTKRFPRILSIGVEQEHAPWKFGGFPELANSGSDSRPEPGRSIVRVAKSAPRRSAPAELRQALTDKRVANSGLPE